MVSKPTGNPRGRPRKERAPKAVVGRPKMDLASDPDRYSLALLSALTKRRGMDARPAARLAAAFTYGVEVEPGHNDWKFAILADLVKQTPGMVALQFGRNEESGAKTTTLEGRADTLREKLRKPRSGDDGRWLQAMSDAFALTLTAERPARHYIVAFIAESVGEKAFYDKVLRSIIDEKIGFGKAVTPADVEAELAEFLVMTRGL